MMKLNDLTDASERSLTPFFAPPILDSIIGGVFITCALAVLSWPWDDLYIFISENNVPRMFFIIFAATLIVNSYINLRCGRGEMIKKSYYDRLREDPPTFEEERNFLKCTLLVFLLHILFLLLPFFPLLILAASVSAATPLTFLKASADIFIVALLCRVFGFTTFLWWGRTSSVGYFFARAFMIVFIFGTLLIGRALNPIYVLYRLSSGMSGTDDPQLNSYFIFTVTAVCAVSFLVVMNQALMSGRATEEKES